MKPPTNTLLCRRLSDRGVPPYLWRHPGFDVRAATKAIPARAGEMSVAAQLQNLVNVAREPLGRPYLYAVGGQTVSDNAALVALTLAAAAVRQHNLPLSRYPLWHRPSGTGTDALLDRRGVQSAGPSLLVIDGLIEESNSLRVERARDILQVYSHLPRIVVLAGAANPVAFVQQRLRLAATYYLNLSDRSLIIQL